MSVGMYLEHEIHACMVIHSLTNHCTNILENILAVPLGTNRPHENSSPENYLGVA